MFNDTFFRLLMAPFALHSHRFRSAEPAEQCGQKLENLLSIKKVLLWKVAAHARPAHRLFTFAEPLFGCPTNTGDRAALSSVFGERPTSESSR